MNNLPQHIISSLNSRSEEERLRSLHLASANGVDFYSNDYLGLAGAVKNIQPNFSGAAGSRLLSGNQASHENAERAAQNFWGEAALLFNSGYQANIGLLQSLPKRGDTLIFDQLCHASIRDGIVLSRAKSWSYAHQNLTDLEAKLKQAAGEKYVVTEGVFSMTGKRQDLKELLALCKKHDAFLILDEAHSVGIYGENGKGLGDAFKDHPNLLARIFPLGKAFGLSGAFVVGPEALKSYLVNFARSFIYTTAMPPVLADCITEQFSKVAQANLQRTRLNQLISFWNTSVENPNITRNATPIQFFTCPAKGHAEFDLKIKGAGFQLKSIKYPTVAKDAEGYRVVLHSYNIEKEIQQLQSLFNEQA